MKHHLFFFYLLFLMLTQNVCSQNLPAFSSMDVFELEWVSDPQISPGGDQIVYVRRSMDKMKDKRVSSLWIVNSDGSEHQKLTSREVNESSPRWSPSGDRIAFISSTDNGAELYMFWVKKNKIARISQLDSSPGNLSWSPDGNSLAFTMKLKGSELKLVTPPKKPKGAEWAEVPRVTTRFKYEKDGAGYISPGYYHIFLIPAEGGSAKQLTHGPYNFNTNFQWSPDGQSLIFSGNIKKDWEYDFRNSEIYSLSIKDGKIIALTDRKGPDVNPVISTDGQKIGFLGFDDKVQAYQIRHLYLMDFGGENKKKISLNIDRNISSINWSASGKSIYFKFDDHGNTKLAKTDLAGNWKILAHNLGGTTIGRPYGGGSYSVSTNGHIAFNFTTPYHPGELAVYNGENGSISQITSLNEDILGQRELARLEEFNYKSTFDRRDIQGWIAKPPGFDASKKYPLLIENHGGPISNYGDRFSPEIQLYASGGYVVFYPNPRGSTSYGEEFGNLLHHNYPGEDYQDIMDGIDAILELGYIEKDSLFVTGGSAGGIMTSWIIGKTNRFRAAAVIKPVMNWISKTLTADNYFYYADSRYPGQPWENPEIYWKFSPVSLVGNIGTPTLVMVGSNDMRTPISEAKQLYNALKIRKIDTALVEMPGSAHNIANRPSQLIAKIEYILAWFERYK